MHEMSPSCTSTQRRQKGIRWHACMKCRHRTSASFVLCCYYSTCSSLAASISSRLCYKFLSICLYAAVTPCLYARIKDRNSTPYYTLVLRHQLVLSISGKLLHTYEHSNCVLPYLSVVTNKHWCCIVYWTMSQSIHRCTFLFAFTVLPPSQNKCYYAIRTRIYRK